MKPFQASPLQPEIRLATHTVSYEAEEIKLGLSTVLETVSTTSSANVRFGFPRLRQLPIPYVLLPDTMPSGRRGGLVLRISCRVVAPILSPSCYNTGF